VIEKNVSRSQVDPLASVTSPTHLI
jgi:hypothetical protein